jgi:hypothetical protein
MGHTEQGQMVPQDRFAGATGHIKGTHSKLCLQVTKLCLNSLAFATDSMTVYLRAKVQLHAVPEDLVMTSGKPLTELVNCTFHASAHTRLNLATRDSAKGPCSSGQGQHNSQEHQRLDMQQMQDVVKHPAKS